MCLCAPTTVHTYPFDLKSFLVRATVVQLLLCPVCVSERARARALCPIRRFNCIEHDRLDATTKNKHIHCFHHSSYLLFSLGPFGCLFVLLLLLLSFLALCFARLSTLICPLFSHSCRFVGLGSRMICVIYYITFVYSSCDLKVCRRFVFVCDVWRTTSTFIVPP